MDHQLSTASGDGAGAPMYLQTLVAHLAWANRGLFTALREVDVVGAIEVRAHPPGRRVLRLRRVTPVEHGQDRGDERTRRVARRSARDGDVEGVAAPA